MGKANYHSALPFFYASRPMWLKIPLLVILLTFINVYPAHCEPLPLIQRLDYRDTVFRQYLSDVEAARRVLFSSRQRGAEEIASSLTVYSFIPHDEELLGIAARCNVPYATLASINRFSHVEDLLPGKVLLLPSMPGLFVPEKPESDLERLLFFGREDTRDLGVIVIIPRDGKNERFLFLPGDDFLPTERVFFLNRGFHFPLQHFEVSSSYGPRVNPLTGKPSVHRGLDLAAPEGTPVYAVRNGTVVDLGEDAVLGKYVILSHDNNWVSFYGHLSTINTALRTEVQSGSLIARVGSTGQSTGPHLHFELRQNGQSRDPTRLLGLFKGITGR